jgi:amino acid permease
MSTYEERKSLLHDAGDGRDGLSTTRRPAPYQDSPQLIQSAEEEAAHAAGVENPEPSLGNLNSFMLTFNNTIGPGLVGLPTVFLQAGLVPTLGCILLFWVSSSFCGTVLSDVISCIPGNSSFDANIDFSTAFRIIMGEDMFYFAETFFLLSCGVQVVAGLIEAAQSLDGFLASHLIGSTYALQVFPSPGLLQWDPSLCAQGSNCVPFQQELPSASSPDGTDDTTGPILIISLGYILSCAVFFPFSRGHLKETILLQTIVFAFTLVFVLVFNWEFLSSYADWEPVPLYGNNYATLAGVILFNYAFPLTVPSWLKEKQPSVSVNQTIWYSTGLCTVLYILFGWWGACAFPKVDQEILPLLSGPRVGRLTQLSAAVFGVIIMGAGVPVFCVMIKSSLYAGRFCGPDWAFFLGSVCPYLLSWLLYQGSVLMDLLNWCGLLVNGTVCFILPLALAIHVMRSRARRAKQPVSGRSSPRGNQALDSGLELGGEGSKRTQGGEPPAGSSNERRSEETLRASMGYGSVFPMPRSLDAWYECLCYTLLSIFLLSILSTFVVDMRMGITPDSRRRLLAGFGL